MMTDNENERLTQLESKVDLLIGDVRALNTAVSKYVVVPGSMRPPMDSVAGYVVHTGKKAWYDLTPEQRAKFVETAAWGFRIATAMFAAWAAAKGLRP
jgi:carbamate kinase